MPNINYLYIYNIHRWISKHMGNKSQFLCKRMLSNFCRYSTHEELEQNSLLRGKLRMVIFTQNPVWRVMKWNPTLAVKWLSSLSTEMSLHWYDWCKWHVTAFPKSTTAVGSWENLNWRTLYHIHITWHLKIAKIIEYREFWDTITPTR